MDPAPGRKRRATSYDVARGAGVAQSTVSRCFQADSGISPRTREHVLAVARRLGYVPNALARSLITRRSDMVGVIATRYTLRANPDVIYALGETLSASGKQLLLVTVESDFPGPAALRGALEYPLDGLVSCVLIADDLVRQIMARGVAVVFYNRMPERVPADWVSTDHVAAGAEVAAMLHAAGHRRLLCIGGPATAPVSRQRTSGFLDALTALGAPAPPVLATDFSYPGGRAAFLEHLAAGPERPEAVFCANDQIALGVMDACRFDLGWEVPRDISIIGFDDVAEAGRPGYQLTTMHQDSVGMARQAVQLLLARLADPDAAPVSSVVASVLVRRHSARLA